MHAIKIVALPLGPFQVFTYILACRKTGDGAIIDPAGDPPAILVALARENVTPRMILNTHGHPDHVLANAALKAELDVPVWMHAEDNGLYADAPDVAEIEQQTGLTVDTTADRMFSDGEQIVLGETEIHVLHTPGHTPGSCCFLVDGHLFTGDTLFVGDVGRTDLKGGSLDQLIQSIETKLLDLPDNTCVWPGHDYNINASIPQGEAPTTIGKEKQENPYITDFIIDP